MTNEERDIIARFIARVAGAAQPGGFSGGSVPTAQPALPPIDREADAFIAELFQRYPEARYRITQMAFVQEAALAEAQNRIRRLEWALQQAQQAGAQNQPQQAQGRGFFGNLFGGGQQRPQQPQYQPPPMQPQYAPGMAQPGMFQRGGSGFLGSALTTAAGVAGGLVAGNALMDLFSGSHGGGGGFGGSPSETIINNNYGDQAGGDPWGGGGVAEDPSGAAASQDDLYGNAGGGDPGWDQAGGDPGWDQGGGSDDDSWT